MACSLGAAKSGGDRVHARLPRSSLDSQPSLPDRTLVSKPFEMEADIKATVERGASVSLRISVRAWTDHDPDKDDPFRRGCPRWAQRAEAGRRERAVGAIRGLLLRR